MTTFQMILLALGALLGVSAFWDQIKNFISKPTKEADAPTPAPSDHRHDPKDSLAEVVVCWEHLQDELKQRGLNKAAAELTKIFPLFIDAVKEDSQPDQGA
jgi:hypothetical protein